MKRLSLGKLLHVSAIIHTAFCFLKSAGLSQTATVERRLAFFDDSEVIPSTSRRGMLSNMVMVASTAMLPSCPALAESSTAPIVPSPAFTSDLSWPLGKVAFSLLPLAGTSSRRATVEECIVPDTIWTHDQIQGVVNVNVPVRQTVIRLKDGGLWVHNPVAPTPQLLAMMKSLETKHGPVRHIVLGTVALEHKATFGPFCKKFPRATVWIQPGQWVSVNNNLVHKAKRKFPHLRFLEGLSSRSFDRISRCQPERRSFSRVTGSRKGGIQKVSNTHEISSS
jgi:hypothetical protein